MPVTGPDLGQAPKVARYWARQGACACVLMDDAITRGEVRGSQAVADPWRQDPPLGKLSPLKAWLVPSVRSCVRVRRHMRGSLNDYW